MTEPSAPTTRGHSATISRASQRRWQREQTIGEIERAAMPLLVRQGYRATTAEHLAEAAGVSVRTLFRYFPSGKDDVVLVGLRRSLDMLEEEIRARPPSESLVEALAAARVAWLERLQQSVGSPPAIITADGMRLAAQIATEQPDLLSRLLGERHLLAERLVDDFAARLRLDPEIDVRPRLLAHCYMSALVTGYLTSLRSPDLDGNLVADEAIALITPLMAAIEPEAQPARPKRAVRRSR